MVELVAHVFRAGLEHEAPFGAYFLDEQIHLVEPCAELLRLHETLAGMFKASSPNQKP